MVGEDERSLNARDPSRLEVGSSRREGSGGAFALVAIVWPSPDPVDVYAAAGQAVVVPRADCAVCGTAMGFWSGYWRWVRAGGVCHRVWIRRVKCGRCAVTQSVSRILCE